MIKTLDPDWIRIGNQLKMLDPDPDPYQTNTDPLPWKFAKKLKRKGLTSHLHCNAIRWRRTRPRTVLQKNQWNIPAPVNSAQYYPF
jgi:hypothetical protein